MLGAYGQGLGELLLKRRISSREPRSPSRYMDQFTGTDSAMNDSQHQMIREQGVGDDQEGTRMRLNSLALLGTRACCSIKSMDRKAT